MPYEQYNIQAGMYNAPQVNPYAVGSNHHETRPVVSHHASYPSVQSSGELAAQMARMNLDTSGQASYTKSHKQRPANPRVETAPASSLLQRTTSSARRSRPAVVEPFERSHRHPETHELIHCGTDLEDFHQEARPLVQSTVLKTFELLIES